MYVPKHFDGGDEAAAFDFIDAHGFAQLTGLLDGELFCTHLPLMLDRDGRRLLGHVAVANPQAKALAGQKVQCTFAGPHGYVSPSWYHSSGVPTWNYQAAHVYGTCQLIEDDEAVHHLLRQLTQQYEAGEATPWQPNYNPGMIKAIVGFEIALERVDLKFKLSQNRSKVDQQSVVHALRLRNNQALAEAMVRQLDLDL